VKALALVLSCSLLTGCLATTGNGSTVEPSARTEPSAVAQFLRAVAGPGPGLAAHDPRSGQLFDQIPNWDNAAQKRCCSALARDEYLKSRCDTDEPLGGRTNRC
jgi:hypothetical protein